MTQPIPFLKMHGAGNDFVLIDARESPLQFDQLPIAAMAHRQKGIGFDQLVWLQAEASDDAVVYMRLANADGGEISACGNATRCVASLLLNELNTNHVSIRTKAGVLHGERRDGQVWVNMGKPRLAWNEIPLSRELDTLNIPSLRPDLPSAVAVSMGNPHAVMFVDNVMQRDVASIGAELEHHKLFPERANISLATVEGPNAVRLRVWERGVGITLACGTAACATLVAAVRRGLMPSREAAIHLPGGTLFVRWDEKTEEVWMSGPVAVAFQGLFRLEDYSA